MFRNSFKGIQKQMKKIMNKIPADPYEAELLALAGNIAEDEKDSSDSEDDAGEFLTWLEKKIKQDPTNITYRKWHVP